MIDLLWGTSRFRHDDRERVVHTIMTNLDKRVSADVSASAMPGMSY